MACAHLCLTPWELYICFFLPYMYIYEGICCSEGGYLHFEYGSGSRKERVGIRVTSWKWCEILLWGDALANRDARTQTGAQAPLW